MADVLEVDLGYRAGSVVVDEPGGLDLRLSTPAGSGQPALFFDGFLNRAEQSACALLAVATVAASRYWTPPGLVAAQILRADPVVTSNGDRLRFESFSLCCGVAARFDVLPGGLSRPPSRTGTTNVDVNPPLRAALTRVRGNDTLHLAVGTDVTVTTPQTTVVEPKVALPLRWVRGFAEAQAAAADLVPRGTFPAAAVRRFLRSLPSHSNGNSQLYAVPGGAGLRLGSRPGGDAVPLGGPHRLRILEPALRHARSLTVFGPAEPGPGVSVWQLDLDQARLSLTMSPVAMRGFSGEGQLLFTLADPRTRPDADLVSALLAFDPVIDPDRLAREAALPLPRVKAALAWLAASGRVGYDPAEQAYFHRELPWLRDQVEVLNPRLRDAQELVAAGAVAGAGEAMTVRSGDVEYLVGDRDGRPTCTCPWFAQHQFM